MFPPKPSSFLLFVVILIIDCTDASYSLPGEIIISIFFISQPFMLSSSFISLASCPLRKKIGVPRPTTSILLLDCVTKGIYGKIFDKLSNFERWEFSILISKELPLFKVDLCTTTSPNLKLASCSVIVLSVSINIGLL